MSIARSYLMTSHDEVTATIDHRSRRCWKSLRMATLDLMQRVLRKTGDVEAYPGPAL
jgi:hypothetical protein